MNILLLLILLIVIFMIAVSLVLLVIGPVLLLQPYRRTSEWYRQRTDILHPTHLKLPFEDILLKTKDGFDLSCWLIKAPQPARGTILILHGVSESKIAGLKIARQMYEVGYNVFLYDSRRHGESGGKFCTYGYHEKFDAQLVIDYLLTRADLFVGKIGVFGWSMGAAVALQLAAIDSRVSAVVAESGFASLRTVFDDYQKRIIKLPWHYLRNIVIKRSEFLASFRANDVSPMKAVRQIHIPIFLLHGTEDGLINYDYSERVYKAANHPKEFWLIPGAKHHDMMEVGGAEYSRRIIEFFEKHV
ncbi:MAG: alpha/beta fold hydrolase [Ignavibacteriae bacterium]|nr:alpha/beta fold hydrolase [Ignavibacteriota bacterium]